MEPFMTQQANTLSFSAPHQPVPAFGSMLAAGAMLASLAVVAYACLHSPDAAVRVQTILQGARVILLTVVAGAVASGLHLFSVAGSRAIKQIAPQQQAAA
jgi:membrane associated rhomboid family serine protease